MLSKKVKYMKKIKTLMAIGVASAIVMQVSSCQDAQRENPLLQQSEVAFGAPDFSKIQTTDYLPAFEVAIQQAKDNIAKIVENQDSATFENTILAFEESDRLLDHVSRVFYALPVLTRPPRLQRLRRR